MASAARKLTVVTGPSKPEKAPRKPAMRPLAARRLEERLSYIVAGGCIVGLCLSGLDSAFALNGFFKVPMLQAAMLAIIVDGGLVGAEIATLISPCKKVHRAAYVYIIMAGLLSIGLNAGEFAMQSAKSQGGIVMGGIVGGMIPLLVLICSRYAGYLYLSSRH